MENSGATARNNGPQFRVFKNITQQNLPKMLDDESMKQSETFFLDVVSNQNSPTTAGKEMVAGLFRMMAGKSLDYRYTYEELKYIVEGTFVLTDGTGQRVVARAGDLVYFPKGCQVNFATPYYALGCFTGQRKEGEEVGNAEGLPNPPLKIYKQVTSADLPKMTDNASMRNSETYFADIAQSPVEGKEMVSGCFRMMAGHDLEYTYEYEEMKYVAEGEFVLTDGTGQTAVAKAGDVIYFPKGCQVTFHTNHYAVGVFTGQRKWGAY
jgi:ethanolamine utilization protein EutQ (cupin superfamily)